MLKRGCILLGIVIMMVNTKGVVAANYNSHEVKIYYLHKSTVDNYSIVLQGNKCHLINTDTNIKDNFKGRNGLVDICIGGNDGKINGTYHLPEGD